MPLDVARARCLLKEGNLRTLFVEELGWDRYAERIQIPLGAQTFQLEGVAHKRDFAVLRCAPAPDGGIPSRAERLKIDRAIAKLRFEHIIVYTDSAGSTQVWQWVKREAGKPAACREHTYWRHQTGEPLIQKLQHIAFSLQEEEELNLFAVTARAGAAFDVGRVTKRFYDRFRAEHAAFLKFIKGIPDEEMQRWYASAMINRLMFNYFIQKKGFLNADHNYLKTKLGESQRGGRDRYYADFLCPLFFEGFAMKPAERSAAVNRLLGQVPYLNGGLFQRHQIEELYGTKIQIGDAAFEQLFAFFEQYQWHLDERPNRRDDEINPDVLGYIFEKYINQKQMGAYYTKEDITGYIAKNTIIPFLFDAARKDCVVAFKPTGSVWSLLKEDPDRYIYDAMKKGAGLDLPSEIAAGQSDVSMRDAWNRPARSEYALPTEIWREVVARRRRHDEVHGKMACGEIQSVNDLITYNLDIRQFAQDVIENCEGPELLRAMFHAIERVSVLDPTCGSGAFLFAALNVLEPLYEACLDRMQAFLDDLERSGRSHRPEKFSDFRKVLEQAARHPNRKYFILKSIAVNNLYGVDIMEEAVEICKLRLFLKLVAQVEQVAQIEPLPDIDFNIRAGNTLVGYANREDVRAVLGGQQRLDFEGSLQRIEEEAHDIARLFDRFREQQTEFGGVVTAEHKRTLRTRLEELEDELNWYLAGEYGIKKAGYKEWLANHHPFHWFIDFHGIMSRGGFDVIIGNPPYVVFSTGNLGFGFRTTDYKTADTKNLYALCFERALRLAGGPSPVGLIVQLTSMSSEKVPTLQNLLGARGITLALPFPRRPESVFDGVEMPVAILISFKSQSHRYVTTKVNRFYTDERPFAMDVLELQQHDVRRDGCRIAKIGSPLQLGICEKIRKQGAVLGTLACRASNWQFYYQEACRYWVKACIGTPYFKRNGKRMEPPHGRIISFSSESSCAFAGCLANSSLFYWFYSAFCDCEHINDAFLRGFPIPATWPQTDWKALGAHLSADLARYATRKVISTKQGHTIEYDEMKAAHSKSVIDRVDHALAKAYGLTADELDFIMNYDIKYRMGRDTEEGDGDGE